MLNGLYDHITMETFCKKFYLIGYKRNLRVNDMKPLLLSH